MIWYDVNDCDCCRKMCINYDDNLLEKINVIKRYHLTKKIHNAWICCCINTNSGKQFIVLKNQLNLPILG